MISSIRNFLALQKNDDEGASAVEYGLLVAAIAAVIILLVFALGGFVKDAFQTTCDAFAENAQPGTAAVSGGAAAVPVGSC